MSTAVREGVGFRSERGPVLIALMLTTGLVAIDATILATAVPSIVADLGGFSQFPWLFSVYLLAQAASVPVYAKLADTVGRKPIVLDRHLALPARLDPLRLRLEHARAHRLPRGPGPRRGRGAADGGHDRRRHLHRRRAREGAGLPRERVGDLVRRRPDARWRLLPVHLVALDLLRQRPAVLHRGVDAHPQLPREHRAPAPPHRLRGRRAAHGRDEPAHPRRARGRPGLGLELGAEHRRLRAQRPPPHRLRPRRAAGGRARPARSGSSRGGSW